MEDIQVNKTPIQFPKGLDILTGILNPPKPLTASAFKQQTTPRNKQQRGGNNKQK